MRIVLGDFFYINEKLYTNFSKGEFWLREVQFFSSKRIKVDSAKIGARINWEGLKTPMEVRSFIGLASYCRRFVQDFARKLHNCQS